MKKKSFPVRACKKFVLFISLMAFNMGISLRVQAQSYTASGLQASVNGSSNNLWGTGYYGGQQGCNYPMKVASGAVDQKDAKSNEKNKISSLEKDLDRKKKEKDRAETEMELVEKKLARYLDSEVLDFILRTHIEKLNKCSDYKTFPSYNCDQPKTKLSAQNADTAGNPVSLPLVTADCGAKDDVPKVLKANWSEGKNYCTANSDSSKGAVSGAICADISLRANEGSKNRSVSATECSKFFNDFRKFKVQSENIQAKIEKIEDDIERKSLDMASSTERPDVEKKIRQTNEFESACEDCDMQSRGNNFQKSQGQDWASIFTQIGAGFGLGLIGRQVDKNNQETQAQYGYPPQQGYPTAVSMGLPFILGGVYGAISGGSGQGGFGCAGGTSGAGNNYGAYGGMNNIYGGGVANSAYGLYGNTSPNSGAFGYPQSLYGSVAAGGIYNTGYTPYSSQYGLTQAQLAALTPLQQAQLAASSTTMAPLQQAQYYQSYGNYGLSTTGITTGVYGGINLNYGTNSYWNSGLYNNTTTGVLTTPATSTVLTGGR